MTEAKYVSFEDSGDAVPQLGREMRREMAMDFEGCRAFTNQGGVGVCPKRVVEYRHALFYEMESNPDYWFRHKVRRYYDEALEATAEFLGSEKENLVFVPNVTTGLNVAFKAVEGMIRESMQSLRKPKLLITSLTYNATELMARHLAESTGAEIVVADMSFPIISEEDAVGRFRQAYLNNPGVELAVVDHISSASAIFWPLEKIVSCLKGLGCKRIIVDGAHAPGQVKDLNLEELGRCGVDYYSGNLHKWGLAPRGCALLWCRPELQDQALPNNTSHLHRQTYQDRFYEQGTLDYSNYMAAPAAISFVKSIGGLPAMHEHASELLDWAKDMLLKAFGTEEITTVPKCMEAPYMRLIALPEMPQRPQPDFWTSMKLTGEVVAEYRVGLYITGFAGRYWVRISAGIFNEREDYLELRDALIDKCSKYKF